MSTKSKTAEYQTTIQLTASDKRRIEKAAKKAGATKHLTTRALVSIGLNAIEQKPQLLEAAVNQVWHGDM